MKLGSGIFLCLAFCGTIAAFQPSGGSKGRASEKLLVVAKQHDDVHAQVSRRTVFFDAATVAAAGATALIGGQQTARAASSNGLPLTASPSGLKWADARC